MTTSIKFFINIDTKEIKITEAFYIFPSNFIFKGCIILL